MIKINNRIKLLGLTTSFLFFSGTNLFGGIDITVLGKSHGGQQKESIACKDGIGFFIIPPKDYPPIIKNSEYNKIVLEYSDKVKYSNKKKDKKSEFKWYIANNKELSDNIKSIVFKNTSKKAINRIFYLSMSFPTKGMCNDKNPLTINDMYNRYGLCSGISKIGTSCDDGDFSTIYDTVDSDGKCHGQSVVGLKCDDLNIQTINDQFNTKGVCAGTNVEGQKCDDHLRMTYNDTYHNGLCSGIVDGLKCDDNNPETINDHYDENVVCFGINKNEVCDDNNPDTINDRYDTINDRYDTKHVCYGEVVQILGKKTAPYYGTDAFLGVITSSGWTRTLSFKNISENGSDAYITYQVGGKKDDRDTISFDIVDPKTKKVYFSLKPKTYDDIEKPVILPIELSHIKSFDVIATCTKIDGDECDGFLRYVQLKYNIKK